VPMPMQTHAAARKLEHSLSLRMKEVYHERQAGAELDAEYGDNVGGPPKNRRAGRVSLCTPTRLIVEQPLHPVGCSMKIPARTGSHVPG